ncbi:reverse transcriptase domain-containing protein [Tanacetum coccineum]|uniref:Reverse transcriptase domain-containing protein n=1 Tax=Tanacetum coccineum TaxID=301880 RepID=A0ABQ5I9G1_9ASTR
MDDPNITMEEYIKLEEEKARRRVFNDALTYEVALSCEPTVSPLNDNQINFRISFDESDDKDYTDKSSFEDLYDDCFDLSSYGLVLVALELPIFQIIHRTIPRRRNRRRAPNVFEPELRIIVEVAPMVERDNGSAYSMHPRKRITPAPVKAVEEICVTCSGLHAWYNCPNTDNNQSSVCAATASITGTLPSNTIPNSKGEMKVITTRSGVAYEGPSIPTNPSHKKAVEREIEETTDKEQLNFQESTAHIPPPVNPIQIPRPDVPENLPKPNIPYPSRRNDQKFREKASYQKEKIFQMFQDLRFDISFADTLFFMPRFAPTIRNLLMNKEKLLELAKIPLNENCSAMLLKKLPKKLGDPGKFLIPCNFPGMDVCHALADLGASINLMPLSIWKKLSLPELTPTRMTLELADRSITHPKGLAEDVYVKVGKFHFPTDFVVVDFEADPRVPLILGRSFLRTGRALIDVYGEEITLRVDNEAITFNLDQTTRYSSTNDKSVNRIDIIDERRNFVRHKISKSGIEVDRAKVDVIAKLPHLTTVKGTLKKNLTEAPILVIPDWNLPFELMCDASDFAIEAQIHYTTTEKEVLAVVYAFEKFQANLVLSKSIVNLISPSCDRKQRIEQTLRQENHASWSDKLDDALWEFRTAFKTPIGCTPYKLVYGKSCHLPIELEHKAYWALKHANFDLKTAGDHRKFQLDELNELRDQAYENSLIYKERTKKLHDSKIKNRIFNVGDRVLLFNSRLKIFSEKLKTRWSGLFTITKVFPYRTIELSQPAGPNFKVNGHRVKHYFGGDLPPKIDPKFPKENLYGVLARSLEAS